MSALNVLPPQSKIQTLNILPPQSKIQTLNILPPQPKIQTLNVIPPCARTGISGVYILKHPFYPNTVKIGSSIDIGSRIINGDYRTMFFPDHVPKLIGYFTHEKFQTEEEVRYLEKSIHRFLATRRYHPRRELFQLNFDDTASVELLIMYFENLCQGEYTFTHSGIVSPEPGSLQEPNIGSSIIAQLDMNIRNNRIIPLDHQMPIIEQINTFFRTNNHGKLILPCGYGKMYIGLFYLQNSHYNNVIILVPSLILMEQFVGIARKVLPGWNIISVSGEGRGAPMAVRNLVISTYQSAKFLQIVPDFVIYDEAHRTCVNKCQGEESQFHDSLEMFPNSKKMFMTATEKISYSDDHNRLTGYYSMNQEEYGPYIVRKTFEDAINEKVICDYTIAVPLTDENSIDVITSAFNELNINHLLVYTNRCDDANAISAALNEHGIKSYYLDGTFKPKDRNRILHEFQQVERGVLCSVKVLQEGISLPIVDSIYFIDSRSSEIDITQMIGRALRLHSDKSLATIIVPSDMFKNKPLLTTLVQMDSRPQRKTLNFSGQQKIQRKSPHDITLSINRQIQFILMNRNRGKWDWKLLLCIQYEHENQSEYIKNSTQYKGINIGNWMGIQNKAFRGQYNPLSQEKLEKLNQLRSWRKWIDNFNHPDRQWNNNLNLCLQYELENPTKLITQHVEYNGVKIATWFHNQRSAYRGQGTYKQLTDEQKLQLNHLRSWQAWLNKEDNSKQQWDEKLSLCIAYETENPTRHITQYTQYKGVNIETWLHHQKEAYKGTKDHKALNESQKERLTQLRTWVFWLQTYNNPEYQWDTHWNNCKEYESLYPTERIKTMTVYKEDKIGKWFINQTCTFKGQARKCLITAHRCDKLYEIRSWRDWLTKNKFNKYPDYLISQTLIQPSPLIMIQSPN